MRFLLFSMGFIFCLIACKNRDKQDVNPEDIFFDYKISAEEGREDATVMLQFRFGDENGTALVLEEPSKITVDGIELKVDSAKLTGAFYELTKPVEAFKGKHTIVFTDSDEKEHKEEFNFEPFTLAAELPEQVKMKPFTLKLKGFPAAPTPIQLVMVDTSHSSLDVNEEILIENGEIEIDETKLANLTKGPVNLEIYREEERAIGNGSKEGGRLLITYSLKRQFELVK